MTEDAKVIKGELHDIAIGIRNLTNEIKSMRDAIALFNNNYIALNQGLEMNSFAMDDNQEENEQK